MWIHKIKYVDMTWVETKLSRSTEEQTQEGEKERMRQRRTGETIPGM